MDMADYRLEKISDNDFSRFHAVYARENIFLDTDWSALTENAHPSGSGCLLFRDGVPIGGAACGRSAVSSPFMIPPFSDRAEFWRALLSLCSADGGLIRLERIPQTHAEALASLGARKTLGQFRMMRPTEQLNTSLDGGYRFAEPSACERNEIVNVIYQAHLSGNAPTVNGRPAIEYVRYQTGRRFTAFAQTGTLDMGTIVISRKDGCIAGVCLAGIYPGSPNDFATVHQVSVLPSHRRRGLARAMLASTITKALSRSPAITLGVLDGNPAKLLYESVGFIAGCEYSEYEYRRP